MVVMRRLSLSRAPNVVAAVAACSAFAIGIVLGTHVAGGSDSSCYLNSAVMLARGAVALDQPLVRTASWKSAAETFAPAGFNPSSVDPARLVPICSPGLPLAMAAFRTLHLSEFLVVPLLGALAVWLTFVVGTRIDRRFTGAAAALLLVCSPTFLYQLVQPMSDVPATAWWMLALTWSVERADGTNRPRLAGLAASMAVLTRPNLLPLAGVVAACLFVGRSPRSGLGCVMRFVTGLIPGTVLLAVLHQAMYGSPLATGYGSAGGLMTTANVVPNLRRYVGWLIDAHTPFLLLALAGPAVVRRPRDGWLCLAFAATTLACYLPYLVFDDWWYTRFLLPGIPPLAILSVAALVAIVERVARNARPRVRVVATSGSIALVIGVWLATAIARHAFDLSAWEQHYYRAGTAVAAQVARPASIVTVRNSGSVQYYAGLPTLSWDTLAPDGLEQALASVADQGYKPYLLFEIDEEAVFREQFGRAGAIGRLDWPPLAQVGRTIRLYDPLDRTRFLADGQVRTEFLRESPVPAHDWRRWFR
jgi:hypothetical protein